MQYLLSNKCRWRIIINIHVSDWRSLVSDDEEQMCSQQKVSTVDIVIKYFNTSLVHVNKGVAIYLRVQNSSMPLAGQNGELAH